jgi:hypothetical protein
MSSASRFLILGGFGFFAVVSVLLFLAMAVSWVDPDPPSKAEIARRYTASKIQDAMRSTGCGECKAWASDSRLFVADPRSTPEQIAASIKQDSKLVADLRAKGFLKLTANQSENLFAKGVSFSLETFARLP